MHPRTRRRTRTLASATILALLAVPSAAVAAPDPSPGPEARADSAAVLGSSAPQAAPRAVDPADKFTAGATRAFAAQSTTDFWLRFAEKPDLSAADGITSWSERGDYVYETLVAAAEASQRKAVAELKESGTEYTSYWATNAILVEGGTLDLATDLAADAEVLEVRPTTHYAAPEPVETTTAANEPAAAAGPTWGIAAINADDLWTAGHTGEGIVVANIDTGVDGDHAALSGQYRGGAYSYFSVDGVNSPHDDDGHGTHTMGTMVGGTVEDGGVETSVGVAPGAQWIAAAGGGDGWTDDDLIASGQWILAPYDQGSNDTTPVPEMRPHVVNNSWGSEFPSTDPFMEDILTAWEAAGIFATFSNGNLGKEGCQSVSSPGSRQASYAVGAFTESGGIAPYSARGSGQDGAVKPDIAAPGSQVLSTFPGGATRVANGTSMAAPHVAGSVALLWGAVPELVGNVQATRAILDGSARDMDNTSCGGTVDDNNVWGEGKLNVLAAYKLAQAQAFDTTTAPTISGAGYQVGEPLTATVDAWSPAATFTYQWRRGDADDVKGEMIPGATKATYTPQAADLGASLTVTVVGSADGRTPTSTTSTATPEIAAGVPRVSVPTISGTVRVGSTLRALAGSWTSGTGFSYQWYANENSVRGATGFSFTPSAAERGKSLTVRIVGTRAGYTTASRTSGESAVVASGVFSQSAPAISGVATPGATLRVVRPQSTPTPGAVDYRWKLDGRSIRGATGSSLSVRSWTGRTITVSATVRRTGYTTRTVTSAGAKVGSNYSASPSPRISGTVRVGSRLQASVGRWSPQPSFSYRWYADGVPISGATRSTYSLTGPDYGKRITVSVRTYREGYGTVTRFSSATGAVLTSAVRFPGNDDTGWLVGNDSVPPVTYIAQAGSDVCYWERLNANFDVLARDVGLGQRLLKVQSPDYAIWSSTSCGTWTQYYPGMTTTRASTATHGTYAIGDHVERGVYSTAGPKEAGAPCTYIFYKGFYGFDAAVSHGEVWDAHTVTMPSSATGFETVNCSWKRIS